MIMTILCIETSTRVCSAAIAVDGQCVHHRIDREGEHARSLGVAVDELLGLLRMEGRKLDAVALSQGPGSYTGLRIGTSLAKGICYGLQIPLLPIDTLAVMVASCKLQVASCKLQVAGYMLPMIDARRMEVYDALYAMDGSRQSEVEATVVSEGSFADWLAAGPVYYFGDGAAKCQSVLTHENAHFIDGIVPDARYMGALAEAALAAGETADVAYFDPMYLKEFQAVVSKVKGLK